MKKLMIATAALCAAVGASALESANIVGFNNMPMATGTKQIAGVAFQNTTGGSIDIQEIVPQEDGSAVGEGGATLWYWDTNLKKYVYAFWTEDLYEDDGTEEGKELGYAGWCNNLEDLFIVNHEFAAGQGFWIQPNSGYSTPSVLIAGQIVQSDSDRVGVPLATGTKQMMANPFPVSVSLQGIIPLENGVAIGEGGATLWYWDTDQKKFVYAYWTEDLYEDDGTEEGKELGYAGWCNNLEDLFIVNHVFTAGQGFWIQPNSGYIAPSVTFDNPLK